MNVFNIVNCVKSILYTCYFYSVLFDKLEYQALHNINNNYIDTTHSFILPHITNLYISIPLIIGFVVGYVLIFFVIYLGSRYIRNKPEAYKEKIEKRIYKIIVAIYIIALIISAILFIHYNETTEEAISVSICAGFIFVYELDKIWENDIWILGYKNYNYDRLSMEEKMYLNLIKRNCYSSLTIDNIEIFSIILGEIGVSGINPYFNFGIILVIMIISFFVFKKIIVSNLKQSFLCIHKYLNE